MGGTGADVTVSARAPFPGLTGRGVRIAVIDSGVHARHPHVGVVAGGVTIGEQTEEPAFTDILGHGTAVMAAIQEKAPAAQYFAVRVFQSALRANIHVLARAIEWCMERDIEIVNLSLGTVNPAHAQRLAPLVSRALRQGTILISAIEVNGVPAFPGSLPRVIGASVDWKCRRDSYSCRVTSDGLRFFSSGYPRPIPGVAQERNLHGISFAVANMTGFVARACEGITGRSYENVCSALVAEQDATQPGP